MEDGWYRLSVEDGWYIGCCGGWMVYRMSVEDGWYRLLWRMDDIGCRWRMDDIGCRWRMDGTGCHVGCRF